MVEAEGVENFVLHRAGVQATQSIQRDLLFSTLATDVGPAPDTHQKKNKSDEGVGTVCCLPPLCSAFFRTIVPSNRCRYKIWQTQNALSRDLTGHLLPHQSPDIPQVLSYTHVTTVVGLHRESVRTENFLVVQK